MNENSIGAVPTGNKSVLKTLPIEKIRVDKGKNIRRDWAYDPKNPVFKDILESMKLSGWLDGFPAVVSDHKDYVLCLQGHRRIEAARAVGINNIPCLVLFGLSEQDEARILVDHGRASLDEVEWLEAVKRLMFAGLGRMNIAKALGKKPTWVQDRQRLLALPSFVQEQWRLYQLEGKEAKGLQFAPSFDNIKALHQSLVADQAEGHDDIDGGPKFKEELKKIVTDGTNSIRQKSKQAGWTSEQIQNQGNTCNREWLRKLYLFLSTGVGDIILIQSQLEAAHDAFFGEPKSAKAVIDEVFQKDVKVEA